MPWRNLDLECARTASDIRNAIDHLDRGECEKSLGALTSVLTHNGPTALFLFTAAEKAKNNSGIAAQVQKHAFDLLKQEFPSSLNTQNAAGTAIDISTLSENLDHLLLAKQLLLQVLTYLRYHVKTLKKADSTSK